MSLPTWGERVIAKLESIERMTNTVIAQRDALQAELIAERTRRLAAEDIVDTAERTANPGTALLHLAIQYRTQYPRVEEK